MSEQVKCPKCSSLRVAAFRLDADWAYGAGNWNPANDLSVYTEDDKRRFEDNDRLDVECFYCCECYSAFDRTPPAAGAESGWQKIETAPKASHAILVYCPDNLCTYAVSWGMTDFYTGPRRETWRVFGGGHRESIQNPSHWMPLPAAPKADGEKK